MSLIEKITLVEIKKIFANTQLKQKYLELLSNHIAIDVDGLRNISNIDNAIINTWNYDISKKIIRKLFLNTEKYKNNRDSGNKIVALMDEWSTLGLGELDWPFQPKMFDQHVHGINRKNISENEKDTIVSIDAIKYRRIKDINAQRNDYIEHLIFQHNDNVIPTLGNSRGVDFYINGEPFDQKVSRSVGKNFIEKYGDNYRQIAIQRPDLVARCLYEYQDEARFGSEPRLLVVYLDSDLSLEDIEKSLGTVNFNKPTNIEFNFIHSDGREERYQTYCYIILLHK